MSMYQILGNGLMIDLIDEGFILKIKTKKKWNKYVQQGNKVSIKQSIINYSNKLNAYLSILL